MKSAVAVFLFLASRALVLASALQICQPAQHEQVFYLTGAMADLYVANVYDLGKSLIVFGDNPYGDHWPWWISPAATCTSTRRMTPNDDTRCDPNANPHLQTFKRWIGGFIECAA
ncbi:hypothetical protein ElyMa_001802000 [Elysia marginata]|uniref:Lipase domain-containing protein n=1 Tax=Elysia marginata TaxID=1093978 RepID=A0AAV4EGD2_9GAST|nr:hypothetical protein ElyMa_001802000 [Elysia marginata]